MRSPFAPLPLLLFIFILSFLLVFVQLGMLTVAFEKLGVSSELGFILLFGSLFGSSINLPLFTIRAEPPSQPPVLPFWGLLRPPQQPFTGKTIIAVNLGGCVIPVAFSLFLLLNRPVELGQSLLAIGLVSVVCFLASRPIHGLGIGMPVFVAPVTAAITAVIIDAEVSAPLAYIGGTLGVLIGADLLRLGDIRKMGTPFASIGGAGTFDGIFITGIVAVLLT
ncbi:MAG: hypothetical protein A2V90_04580 [Gammaproteobacteria bacterium RBG_16_57_12]|nr:MAG: hypothetical protein A2V90_04580 [Gammaproteobacteria bacterium RBG_16_57_12]